MSVVDRAFQVATAAVGRAPSDGLAHPFGLAESEPLTWRLSPDVWRELVDWAKAQEYYTADNPDDRTRLLGYQLTVDDTLPPNSMLLEPSPSNPLTPMER